MGVTATICPKQKIFRQSTEIKTWKHPPALRADLSFSSSYSEDNRLISIMGINSTDGGELFANPELLSLTMNCGGGSSPLMDISWTLLLNATPSAGSGFPAMLALLLAAARLRNEELKGLQSTFILPSGWWCNEEFAGAYLDCSL